MSMMGQTADPQSSAARSTSRAALLRIKRGAKLLSEVPLGRARLVVGGGKSSQLRLKNAGLAEQCLVLDLRQQPFRMESLLEADNVLVNGWSVTKAEIRSGDRIEFLGITLELVEPDAPARTAAPAAPVPVPAQAPSPDPTDAIDPYMGKQTAARVKKGDVDRMKALLRAKATEEIGESASAARPMVAPPAAPVAEAPSRARTERDAPTADRPREARAPREAPAHRSPAAVAEIAVPPASPRGVFSRPPWLEFVGNDGVAEARLYIARNGMLAGRQGDLKIQHASISKRHAKFEIRDGQLWVEDAGSTNGTWINRERVMSRALADGDTLHLGAVEFRVRIPDLARDEMTSLGRAPETSIAARELSKPATEQFPQAGRSGVPVPYPGPRAPDPLPVEPSEAPLLQGTEADEDGYEDRDASIRTANRTRVSVHVEEDRDDQEDAAQDEDAFLRGLERSVPPADAPSRQRTEAESERQSQVPEGFPFRPEFFEPDDAPLDLATPEPAPRADFDAPTLDRAARGRKERTEPVEPSRPIDRRQAKNDRRGAKTEGVEVAQVRAGLDRSPQRLAVEEDELPAVRRRRGRGAFAVGGLSAALLVGGVLAWPTVRAAIPALAPSLVAPAPVAATDGGGGGATAVSSRSSGSTGTRASGSRPRSSGRQDPGATRASGAFDPDGDPMQDAMQDPMAAATPALRPGQAMFGSDPIDIGGGGGLDVAVANLEQGPATAGIRVEREIGAEELKSIYLDQGTAVVRRWHPDGWDMAPSASDGADAGDRALGASQIDTNRVNALIRTKFPDVKRCLVGTGGFRGKARVVVQFTIQPNGKLESLSLPQSDIKGGRFEACVLRAIRTIRFPKPKDQSVIVQFPFVFFHN